MANRVETLLFAMNRGEVSTLALARTDMEPLRLAAYVQVNWLPRVIGPMMLRPGTEYIGEIESDLVCHMIPFVAAFNDTALLEMTNLQMRVWESGTSLVTRNAVATAMPVTFATGWTLSANGTATATIVSSTILQFGNLNSGASAYAYFGASISGANQGVEHGMRVVINNGPIIFMIGSTGALSDDIFGMETLDQGTYSLAFTPPAGCTTATVTLQAYVSPENYNTVTQTQPQGIQDTQAALCLIEAAGPITLPTVYPTSVLYNPTLLRYDQSADVVFLACKGYPQYQINRYSPTGWGIQLYRPVKGPMAATVGNPGVHLTPGATTGNITITASQPIFSTDDVGTLLRLFHNGQVFFQYLSFDDTYSDTIEVQGVSSISIVSGGSVVDLATTDRNFAYEIQGTWSGLLSLQRSFAGPTEGFTTYLTTSANVAPSDIVDGLNNEDVWYRWGFEPGSYVSGTAQVILNYQGGGAPGVCHITGLVNSMTVSAEVLVPFSYTNAASDWHQSEWSPAQGFPTCCVLHEGRLWWMGADRWWGSASDDYSNFDFDAVGDAALIDISVGQGPIANINWGLSVDHLLAGADTSVIMARSDAIDDPLTPTNINLRFSVTNGAYPIQGYRIDHRGVYIDQSGRKLYELVYDIINYNYRVTDLTRLNPDIGIPGYYDMCVQRVPDTRVWMVRQDGQLVCFIHDYDENCHAFVRFTTQGFFQNIVKLPGPIEDQIFVVVNRQIQGVSRMYLERFARIDEAQTGLIVKTMDCSNTYMNPTSSINGVTSIPQFLPQLAGEQVVVWADGFYCGSTIVASDGTVQLFAMQPGVPANNGQAFNVIAGLPYTADFISAKLAYGAAQGGTALNKVKRIDHIGLILQNTHYQGLNYGLTQIEPLANAGPPYSGVFISGPTGPADGTLGSLDGGLGGRPAVGGSFDTMWDQLEPLDPLPQVERGITLPYGAIWAFYDEKMIEIAHDAITDPRLHLRAQSPFPCTVLGVSIGLEMDV